MDRSFLMLLVSASTVVFAGVFLFTGSPDATSAPARLPPPLKTKTGEVITIKDCDDARAKGVAPLMPGQPGFRPDLDPDGDGVACPPFH